MRRRIPELAVLVVLFLLHQDLWFWNDATLVLGLPVGLTYHVVYCFVTAGVMAWIAGRVLADRVPS